MTKKASWHKYAPLVFDKKIIDHKNSLSPGTIAYDDFWEEMDYYSIHGYKPKNASPITGKHFFYLNNWRIDVMDPEAEIKMKKLGSPWYRQFDDAYFKMFDECKQDGMGYIVVKARDKGFSEMNSLLVGHEYTMFPRSNVGIAAGLDVSAQTIFTKVKTGLENIREEYRHNVLASNAKKVISGKQVSKLDTIGYNSTIHCRTMDNPNVYKGERLSVMIFEEAGEFKALLEAYEASKACFMSGAIQYGVPVIGGTGGDIEKSSKDFKTMWYQHKSFNLRRMFVPASECYMGETGKKTSSFFDFSTGISNRSAAEAFLKKERQEKKTDGDKKAYNLHLQNYPLTIREAFLKTKNAKFDLDIINFQLQELRENHSKKDIITEGKFEWIDTGHEEALAQIPRRKQRIEYRIKKRVQVKFIKEKGGPVKMLLDPQPHIKNLDLGAIDSFDQDKTGTKGSLGSSVIYRDFFNMNQDANLPACIFTNRTNRAIDFYEGTLMQAIFYGVEMLIEHSKINILDFYKDVGAYEYLKERPETIHSENSKAVNKYGVQMTKDIKARMVELMDEEIKEHGHKIWFENLLMELADFGDRNTDEAMAYGICLLHKKDNYNLKVFEQESDDESDILGLNEYEVGPDGNIIITNTI